MKLNVGDKVRVKRDYQGAHWGIDGYKYCGKTMTIRDIIGSQIYLKEDPARYYWLESDFEPLNLWRG